MREKRICARHLMKWRTTWRKTRRCSRKRVRKASKQANTERVKKKLRRATKRFSELLCQFSDGSHCETGTSAVFPHFLLFFFIWAKNARVKYFPPSSPLFFQPTTLTHILSLSLAISILRLMTIILVEIHTKRWYAHFNYFVMNEKYTIRSLSTLRYVKSKCGTRN